jgi:hypothetical protein
LGGGFFFTDYLKLKITNYSFSALRRFKFFKPFGFVSFLDRIFNTAYHYYYKKNNSLFETETVLTETVSVSKKEEPLSLLTKIFYPEVYANALKEYKKQNPAFFRSSWKKIKPEFSRYFFKNIGLFRRKFFFSFVDQFRIKVDNFFSFISKYLNFHIKKLNL